MKFSTTQLLIGAAIAAVLYYIFVFKKKENTEAPVKNTNPNVQSASGVSVVDTGGTGVNTPSNTASSTPSNTPSNTPTQSAPSNTPSNTPTQSAPSNTPTQSAPSNTPTQSAPSNTPVQTSGSVNIGSSGIGSTIQVVPSGIVAGAPVSNPKTYSLGTAGTAGTVNI